MWVIIFVKFFHSKNPFLSLFSGLLAEKPKNVLSAEELKIHVVSEDVISDQVKTEGIISQIEKKSLCEWGTNVRKLLT